MHTMGKFLLELCLPDYAMLEFHPSLLAAGAFYLAKQVYLCGDWVCIKIASCHTLRVCKLCTVDHTIPVCTWFLLTCSKRMHWKWQGWDRIDVRSRRLMWLSHSKVIYVRCHPYITAWCRRFLLRSIEIGAWRLFKHTMEPLAARQESGQLLPLYSALTPSLLVFAAWSMMLNGIEPHTACKFYCSPHNFHPGTCVRYYDSYLL